MNLENILMNIQSQLEIASEEIDWSDDDTLARVNLANAAIRTWATANSTRWDELYTVKETNHLALGSNTITLDDDFMMLDAVVVADTGQAVEIRSPRDSHTPGNYMVLIGNKFTGYKLKYNKDLDNSDPIVGKKLNIYYYRSAKELSSATDTPEMSDPSFIVDYVSAMVASDDDPSKFSIFATNYTQKLKDMMLKNNQVAQEQYSSALDDSDMMVGC